MQFKEFDWLSGHGIWAIMSCRTNMVSVRVNFLARYYFHFSLVFHDFEGFFNKTIIPLALVGYEMIIANSALRAELAYHLISNASSWEAQWPNGQCVRSRVRVRALAGDIVLCSLTVPVSTQEYTWVPAICWGNLTNCREMTCDGLASRPGGVDILLAASCYGNRDKLRQYEPVWLIRLHFINDDLWDTGVGRFL